MDAEGIEHHVSRQTLTAFKSALSEAKTIERDRLSERRC
jgi:Mn-dependent DtxR family transcriptional regulator